MPTGACAIGIGRVSEPDFAKLASKAVQREVGRAARFALGSNKSRALGVAYSAADELGDWRLEHCGRSTQGRPNRLTRGAAVPYRSSRHRRLRPVSTAAQHRFSSRDSVDLEPTGRGVAGIRRRGIEGDGGIGRGLVHGIDQSLEQQQACRRQADATSDHHAVVQSARKLELERLRRGFVGMD